MHQLNEEANIIVSQVLEEICNVNFYKKLRLTPTVENWTGDEKLNDFYSEMDEPLTEKFSVFELNSQKTLVLSDGDFEKHGKNLSEQKSSGLNFANSLPDAFFDEKIVKSKSEISNISLKPILQTQYNLYFKGSDDLLDKAIDKAFRKYETDYEGNFQKLKNASVQTIRLNQRITDKQCQCDLGVSDQPSKRIKLNIYSCVSVEDGRRKAERSEQFEENQPEDIKTECFNRDRNALHIKTSRIRIGLSKRLRPPPLHIINK